MRYDSVQELEQIGRAGAKLVSDDLGERARYLSSFWLYIEGDDQAFTPHWPTGYWESWVSQWLSTQWDNTDTFVDIGANVGYFTFQAAAAGIHTICVEPNPKLVEMIGDSRSVNRKVREVDLWNIALSDYVGRATLWVPEGHSGGANIENGAEGFDVEVSTFDKSYINWDHTARLLFKIDAEGSEPKIWAGMKNTFAKYDCQVLLEWHGVRYDREAFADELSQHQMYVIDYDGSERPIDRQWLVSTEDLHMILVRPKGKNYV